MSASIPALVGESLLVIESRVSGLRRGQQA